MQNPDNGLSPTFDHTQVILIVGAVKSCEVEVMIRSVLKDSDQGSNCGAWCFAWWTFVGPSGAGGALAPAPRAHGGGRVCESGSSCTNSDKVPQ